jgi:hypothetical protein
VNFARTWDAPTPSLTIRVPTAESVSSAVGLVQAWIGRGEMKGPARIADELKLGRWVGCVIAG